jgi:hypothetical protein
VEGRAMTLQEIAKELNELDSLTRCTPFAELRLCGDGCGEINLPDEYFTNKTGVFRDEEELKQVLVELKAHIIKENTK